MRSTNVACLRQRRFLPRTRAHATLGTVTSVEKGAPAHTRCLRPQVGRTGRQRGSGVRRVEGGGGDPGEEEGEGQKDGQQ